MGGEEQKTKFIIDTNSHGIRRERPAVGYKAVKALNKKLKNKSKKKSYWYEHTYWYMYSNPIKDAFIMSNICQYNDMSTNRHRYIEIKRSL